MLIVLPGTGLFFRISSLIAFLHITSGMLWLSGEACRLSRVEVLTHSGSGVREEIGQVAFSCTDFFFFFKVGSEQVSVQQCHQDEKQRLDPSSASNGTKGKSVQSRYICMSASDL